MKDGKSRQKFISDSQVAEDQEIEDHRRDGWTVLKKTYRRAGVANIWKSDTVRHCRGQRTVEGVGSTGIYGWKQLHDEDLTWPKGKAGRMHLAAACGANSDWRSDSDYISPSGEGL